ncbi:putative nucleic acid-binding protein [Bradyrhizobium sp. AZCC 1588]|uniref:type II toxin-antitoxin system VapC family toxin n=1 Tax=unclassified Bradyrhizobium TaxID=2631580 RepID=UPI002FF270CD
MTESRIYLDANVFIYAVEGSPDVAGQLRDLFELFGNNRGIGVTSELTLAEVLPKASAVRKRLYLDLIVWSCLFDLQPVSRDILIETAEYRRMAQMPKLPDAIHVVTAIRAGCRTILSADSRLKLPEGHVALLPNSVNIARLIRELS